MSRPSHCWMRAPGPGNGRCNSHNVRINNEALCIQQTNLKQSNLMSLISRMIMNLLSSSVYWSLVSVLSYRLPLTLFVILYNAIFTSSILRTNVLIKMNKKSSGMAGYRRFGDFYSYWVQRRKPKWTWLHLWMTMERISDELGLQIGVLLCCNE